MAEKYLLTPDDKIVRAFLERKHHAKLTEKMIERRKKRLLEKDKPIKQRRKKKIEKPRY